MYTKYTIAHSRPLGLPLPMPSRSSPPPSQGLRRSRGFGVAESCSARRSALAHLIDATSFRRQIETAHGEFWRYITGTVRSTCTYMYMLQCCNRSPNSKLSCQRICDSYPMCVGLYCISFVTLLKTGHLVSFWISTGRYTCTGSAKCGGGI